uniref:Uncharacterized protein n=1 Tax=Lactuca sativa TaxID=4236 RepID=A0A9R1US04_LACSA|nr:hypothetical protein LSAT_V11C800436980 [Lactuca sativa]
MILTLFTCKYSILDTVATKTLLAILRAHWPKGVFTFHKAPKSFWPTIISQYYCYPRGVSNAEGDAVVRQHVGRTMTQALYEERIRAQERANRDGTSLVEQCPTYFDMRVWKTFCSHWRNRSFKRKSITNKQNREKLQVVHTTGAKPFIKFLLDLLQECNELLTTVDFWEGSHKIKGTDEWASEEARLIGERMRRIFESKESTPDWNLDISILLEAQGPIKKNRIIGLPRVRANSVIPYVQQNQPTQMTRSNNSDNETLAELVRQSRVNSVVSRGRKPKGLLKIRSKSSNKNSGGGSGSGSGGGGGGGGGSGSGSGSGSGGAGPSRSGPGIPNEVLVELAERTLRAFQSDPSFDVSRYPNPEQLHLLAQEVIGGSGSNLAPHVYEVMRTEMVRLMVCIFEEAFQHLKKS